MLRPEDAGSQQQQQQQQQQHRQPADAVATGHHQNDQVEHIPPGARSPHPYRRQSLDIHDRIFVTNLAARERQPHQQQQQHQHQHQHQHQQQQQHHLLQQHSLPSLAVTRRRLSRRDSELSSDLSRTGDGAPGETRWALTTSPSDSGTEADDEKTYLRGLPPAPGKPRKGLKTQSRAVTPSDFDGIKERYLQGEGEGYFGRRVGDAERKLRAGAEAGPEVEARTAQYTLKWRAELLRRVLEHIFLCALTHYCLEGSTEKLLEWPFCYSRERVFWDTAEKAKWLVVWALGSYLLYAFWIWTEHIRAVWKKLPLGQVPSPSDTGSMLYPILLPIAVASASTSNFGTPSILLLNLVLSLCTYPLAASSPSVANIEWTALLIFVLPLNTSGEHAHSLFLEELTFLLPLHSSLVSTIQYFCASSLLSAESQLLSVGLINLLFFASTPQSIILYSLLWMGGMFLLVGCRHVMKWSTTLARIPNWRFRSPRHIHAPASSNELPSTAIGTLLRTSSLFTTTIISRDSSDDREWINESTRPLTKAKTAGGSRTQASDTIRGDPDGFKEIAKSTAKEFDGTPTVSRRHTVPDIVRTDTDAGTKAHSTRLQRRGKKKNRVRPFLWLTRTQATVAKWLFAIYVYTFTLAAIFLPVREYIQRNALFGHEPVGWALGYVFGNIPYFRLQVIMSDFDSWIPLPPRVAAAADTTFEKPSFEYFRSQVLGAASTRLAISGWCALNLAAGLTAVYHLRAVVEVDTRRKVFHGMMVAMFLPSVFVDPCFVALALALMLAVFLLLDLFRAAQLPPLSRPLTAFLAPYVDGRDHKGPVVISPIFLLVGCAIPLWLSLASMPRRLPNGQQQDSIINTNDNSNDIYNYNHEDPWAGWEVERRDVSMVAGVVCVGMGDAAASLIGRRFGRRRWIWSGGKSLEGSAAFVVAVAVGLLAAKAWMLLGRWPDELAATATGTMAGGREQPGSFFSLDFAGLGTVVGKTLLAGAGASFTEAVLTAGNDNVIVPVVLWLLVRCLRI